MKPEKISAAIVIQYDWLDYKAITTMMGGNPAFTGAILNAKYQHLQDIERLLKEGDLVYVDEKLYPEPGIKHTYIICDGKDSESYLQQGVTVSCNRDVEIIFRKKVMKLSKVKPKPFKTLNDIANELKVRFLYVYSVLYKCWFTYKRISKTNVVEFNPNYGNFILNLLCMDKLKTFNQSNKIWLQNRDVFVKY